MRGGKRPHHAWPCVDMRGQSRRPRRNRRSTHIFSSKRGHAWTRGCYRRGIHVWTCGHTLKGVHVSTHAHAVSHSSVLTTAATPSTATALGPASGGKKP